MLPLVDIYSLLALCSCAAGTFSLCSKVHSPLPHPPSLPPSPSLTLPPSLTPLPPSPPSLPPLTLHHFFLKAFVKLESSKELNDDQRQLYDQLSLEIFTRYISSTHCCSGWMHTMASSLPPPPATLQRTKCLDTSFVRPAMQKSLTGMWKFKK